MSLDILAMVVLTTLPHRHIPYPHFNGEIRASAAFPCSAIRRYATDAPVVSLSKVRGRKRLLQLDVLTFSFFPPDLRAIRRQLQLQADQIGSLFLVLDSGPEIDIWTFNPDTTTRVTFRNVGFGSHRLLYGLRTVAGWDVAYGEACFSTSP